MNPYALLNKDSGDDIQPIAEAPAGQDLPPVKVRMNKVSRLYDGADVFKGSRKDTGKQLSPDDYENLKKSGQPIYMDEIPNEPSRGPSSVGQKLLNVMGMGPAAEKVEPYTQDEKDLMDSTRGQTSKFVGMLPKRMPTGPVPKEAPTPPAAAPLAQPDAALPPQDQGAMTSGNPNQAALDAVSAYNQGLNKIPGSKFSDQLKDAYGETTKRNTLVKPEDAEQLQAALDRIPAYTDQTKGLDALQKRVELNDWRRSNRMDLDLSAGGSFADLLNAQQGNKSNLGEALKANPPADTAVSDLGEIQRRRADLAKEFINALHYGKMGDTSSTMSNSNMQTATAGGMNPLMSQRLEDGNFKSFVPEARKIIEDSDKQKAALDKLSGIVRSNNPADIGRIPIQRLKSDTGGARQAVQEVLMEGYNQNASSSILRMINKVVNGDLDERDRADLTASLKESQQLINSARKNMGSRIQQLGLGYHVPEDRIRHAFPQAYLDNSYGVPTAQGTSGKPQVSMQDLHAAMKGL